MLRYLAAICLIGCSGRTGGDSGAQDAGADAAASSEASAADGAADADTAADAPDTPDGQADAGIDCSLVGCAAPPLCSDGCQDICGCCSCADGQIQGTLVCQGGCFVPLDPEG